MRSSLRLSLSFFIRFLYRSLSLFALCSPTFAMPTGATPSAQSPPAAGGGLFRQSASAKHSSPDHLDQLVKIVPPLGWLLLWTIIGILVAALAWGFFGTIPDTVKGRGLLLKGGRLESVNASGPGQIEELLVTRGQHVAKGVPVARVGQPTLRTQIFEQNQTVRDLRTQLDQIERSATAQLDSQTRFYQKQKKSVEQSITDYTRQSQSLQEVVDAQKKLLKDGLIPMTTLLQSQTQLDSTNLNILDAQNQLQEIETNQLEAEANAEQNIENARISLQQAQASLENLQAQLKEDAVVYSPTEGRVVSIDVAIGTAVQAGSQVIVLERTDQPMAALLFFPPGLGKKIEPNMTAQISPVMAPVDQFGYMIGKVTEVGDVPATDGSIMARLANSVDLSFVTEGGQPVLEVTASVDIDDKTTSGYRWSSSNGPPFAIPSGTTCDARVVVRETRPIELVIPLLKKFFGVDS